MRYRRGFLAFALLLITIFPCYVFAQGGETKPPPCCSPEDPPPPPPPPDPAPASMPGGTATVPQITVSEATLIQAGLTRSQFLDRLAAALYPENALDYGLIIPIFSQTTAADGSTTVQVAYFTIAKSQVAPEVIDALDLVFITDGKTSVAVLFTREAVDSY